MPNLTKAYALGRSTADTFITAQARRYWSESPRGFTAKGWYLNSIARQGPIWAKHLLSAVGLSADEVENYVSRPYQTKSARGDYRIYTPALRKALDEFALGYDDKRAELLASV